jgi:hypothetical protein
MFRKAQILIGLIIIISINSADRVVFAGEPWAPYSGYSSVNQDKAYNRFYFSNIEGVYSDIETYEHETQVYNTQFADYDGYWSSNLPRAYYATPSLMKSIILLLVLHRQAICKAISNITHIWL